MRVCVYGAGSVGGLIAALLARAGRPVCAVARGAHLAAIQANGLQVCSTDGDFTAPVRAESDPALLGPQDLVLIATKTPALPGVAAGLAPLLHDGTLVLFAVNGVLWFYGHRFDADAHGLNGQVPDTARLDPDGALHRLVGAERCLGGIIYSSNEVVAPGVIENNGYGRLVIGDPVPGQSARVAAVVAALGGCGMEIEPADDLRRAMWGKLALNVGTAPVAALTGADGVQMRGTPDLRATMTALMAETLAVAAAHGFGGLPLQAPGPPQPGQLGHKPSMLQDLERGRPMEIDSMLAIVQDFARQTGVATPTLDTILPLVRLRAQLAGSYPPAS